MLTQGSTTQIIARWFQREQKKDKLNDRTASLSEPAESYSLRPTAELSLEAVERVGYPLQDKMSLTGHTIGSVHHACSTRVRVYRMKIDLLAKCQGLRPRVRRKTEHTVPVPGRPRQDKLLPCPAGHRYGKGTKPANGMRGAIKPADMHGWASFTLPRLLQRTPQRDSCWTGRTTTRTTLGSSACHASSSGTPNWSVM